MKYMTEFRDGEVAKKLLDVIARESLRDIRIMEFCGGHTITLVKYGIPQLLPGNIEMVSGPGCPVCVTAKGEIDAAIEIAKRPDTILASFGDMVRVPGTRLSLQQAKAEGADVRVVYSPDDAVQLAAENPGKKVVFFAVGFETTAPVTAAAVKYAESLGLKNFFLFTAHKTTPAILGALLDGEVALDAFVCPGHVTTITGSGIYKPLTDAGKPCVVSGFEPLDILSSVLLIVRQINRGAATTEMEYSRVALAAGNVHAQKVMKEVFVPRDAVWRGLGVVPGSGLRPGGQYARFDAEAEFGLTPLADESETPGCLCASVLRGMKKPTDCKLFKTVCKPESPVGACMVSDEGTCSVYYRFGGKSLAAA
ncbi:MAG: hydrogenase formation protein HypD [Nitrospinae bacterium]|nr:hydrogenase formation protein HypD [Nitrospinota bacterium]